MDRERGPPALRRPETVVRAVIFDFDGVIADTEWLHSETFRRVLAEEGISVAAGEHDERFLGINDRAGFAKAFWEVGRSLSPVDRRALLDRKSADDSARIAEVKPYRGAREIIEALSARCPLAIASGGRAAEIDAVLRAHGLREHFLAIASAGDVERSKPAPDAFLAALERLRRAAPARANGLRPAGCLAIEDSLPGIEAAKAAGMRCLAVAHTYPPEKLAAADRVARSIGELRAEEILGSLPR